MHEAATASYDSNRATQRVVLRRRADRNVPVSSGTSGSISYTITGILSIDMRETLDSNQDRLTSGFFCNVEFSNSILRVAFIQFLFPSRVTFGILIDPSEIFEIPASRR